MSIVTRNWDVVINNAHTEASTYLEKNPPSSSTEGQANGRNYSAAPSRSWINFASFIPNFSFTDNRGSNNTYFASTVNHDSHNTNAHVNVNTAKEPDESNKAEQEKKQKEFNLKVFIAGFAIICGAAAATGKFYDSFIEERKNLKDKKAILADAKLDLQKPTLTQSQNLNRLQDIQTLAEKMVEVQTRQTNRITACFASAVLALSGGGCLVAGSFTAAPVLVPTGAVLVVVAVALAVFSYARTSKHEELMRTGFTEQQTLADNLGGSSTPPASADAQTEIPIAEVVHAEPSAPPGKQDQ